MAEKLYDLLRYCKLHPDDHTARLVLADWLEENGRYQQAEFTRLQQLPPYLSSNWYSGQIENFARELRLLKRNVRRWTHGRLLESYHSIFFKTDIPDLNDGRARGPRGRFERGTLSIFCTLAELPEFFERLPGHVAAFLEKITIADAGKADSRGVLAEPEIAEFTSVSVNWAKKEPTPDLNWLDQNHIRELSIGDPSGTGEVWSRLAAASHLRPGKLAASPSAQRYGDWPRFLSSPVVENLSSLTTSIRREASEPFAHLADANLTRLQRLDIYFDGHHYPSSAVQQLLDAPYLASVKDLKLSGSSGDLHGMVSPLALSRSLRQLRKIDLGWNVISETDGAALASSPVLAGVKELRFHASRFAPQGAAALAASPHLAALESIDLSCTGTGDPGLCAIAASPHLRNLRRLNVCKSDVTDLGVQALASSARLTNLQAIDVFGNHFSGEALVSLARSDTLANVRSLRIGVDGLPNAAVNEFLQSPLVEHLECFDIEGITAEHVRILANARLANLRALTLGGRTLRAGDIDPLMEAPWLSGLVQLSLGNRIATDSTMVKMTANLRPGNLAMIWLDRSSLTDVAATALLAWPGLPNIVDLSLDESQISKDRQEEIRKVVVSDNS